MANSQQLLSDMLNAWCAEQGLPTGVSADELAQQLRDRRTELEDADKDTHGDPYGWNLAGAEEHDKLSELITWLDKFGDLWDAPCES